MAEPTMVEKVLLYIWTPWIYILGALGGAEAVMLAVPVTLSMLILGVLTYFLLRYIVLKPLTDKANIEEHTLNKIVFLMTVAITLISLYSGVALLMAAMLETFGIIFAFIAFVVLFGGLILATWRWGRGIGATTRGLAPRGEGLFSKLLKRKKKEESQMEEEIKEDVERIKKEEKQAVHEMSDLLKTVEYEHEAYERIYQFLNDWARRWKLRLSSPKEVDSTINFLKRLRDYGHERSLEKRIPPLIDEIKKNLDSLQIEKKKIKDIEALTAIKDARVPGWKLKELRDAAEMTLEYINQAESLKKEIEQKEKEVKLRIGEKRKLLAELILLLSKGRTRRMFNIGKIKEKVLELKRLTDPHVPGSEGELIIELEKYLIKLNTDINAIAGFIQQIDHIWKSVVWIEKKDKKGKIKVERSYNVTKRTTCPICNEKLDKRKEGHTCSKLKGGYTWTFKKEGTQIIMMRVK